MGSVELKVIDDGSSLLVTRKHRLAGWLVHMFTASGALVGVFALMAIHNQEFVLALWLMCFAIVIDAVDGWFARLIKVKQVVPKIDGALLDNIVDFFNYTMVPSFFLLVTNLVPEGWRYFCVASIIFSSAYQFSQTDAKTEDHFFKGFPSYWNIVIFYLFFWQMNPIINLIVLFGLALLSFVPIKYVYPSRLEYLTRNKLLRLSMLIATVVWGIATIGLLVAYPASNFFLVFLSIGYLILYVGISLYRTWVPLNIVS